MTTRDPIGLEWQPDLFDLNDWAIDYAPALLDVARYLTRTEAMYNLLYSEWVRQGMPNIHATQSAQNPRC